MHAFKTKAVERLAEVEPIRVLIVEADRGLSETWLPALQAGGMQAYVVGSADAAHEAFEAVGPGIVVIGLPLPDSRGFDLVRHFALTSSCGVIVVAGEWAETAGIAGLDAGADDFIAKPAMPDNLVARIRAVDRRLRRSLSPSAPMLHDTPEALRPDHPMITVDATQRCLVGPTGERTLLTEAELSALETLLDAKGANVSREWLGRVALRRMIRTDDRSVDQLVMKLRRKLSAQGVSERAILSARRQGYVIPEPGLFRAGTAAPPSGALPTAPEDTDEATARAFIFQ